MASQTKSPGTSAVQLVLNEVDPLQFPGAGALDMMNQQEENQLGEQLDIIRDINVKMVDASSRRIRIQRTRDPGSAGKSRRRQETLKDGSGRVKLPTINQGTTSNQAIQTTINLLTYCP